MWKTHAQLNGQPKKAEMCSLIFDQGIDALKAALARGHDAASVPAAVLRLRRFLPKLAAGPLWGWRLFSLLQCGPRCSVRALRLRASFHISTFAPEHRMCLLLAARYKHGPTCDMLSAIGED